MKITLALALFAVTSLAIPYPQRGGRFRGGDGGRPPFGDPDAVDQGPPQQPDNDVPPVNSAPNDNNVPPANEPAPVPENNNDNNNNNNNNVNEPAASEGDQNAGNENVDAAPAATGGGGGGGTQGPVDIALLPDFGIEPGQNPRNNGIDCDGNVPGVPIPCTCPPSQEELANAMNGFLAAGQTPDGTPVSFPTGDSLQDELQRLQTSLFTLQNLSGQSGVGCPASSTTFLDQRAELENQIAAGGN